MANDKTKPTIVIRKEEGGGGGHHGGAWKVAYADFVTAMMAFFLLMWLLNATSEEQKRGIADYFSAANSMSKGTSGFGQPFGGHTPNMDGSLASDRGSVNIHDGPPQTQPTDDQDRDETDQELAEKHDSSAKSGGNDADDPGNQPSGSQAAGAQSAGDRAPGSAALAVDPTANPAVDPQAGTLPHPPTRSRPATRAPTDQDVQAELERRERTAFERAAQQIREAVSADPALADLARQLMIDVTPEGLRVQLVDAEKQPMFATGSAAVNERAKAVLAKITPVLLRLPESISITGHTDAAPYKGSDRSNWDLSADRANATRRLLIEAGLPEARIRSVAGMADRDPLITDDKLAAANRRIAIVVLREKPIASR